MKTIKTFLLVVAITIGSVLSASANTEPTKAESKAVTGEIGKLLKSPRFLLETETIAFVKITLNDQNEMVVLSVDSENYQIENFIKNRLNYAKLATKINKDVEAFIVPVRVVPTN